MDVKVAACYFAGLTGLLVLLVGFLSWHGNDTEFRYHTAVRMHACDILEHDSSTLPRFEPERCEVRRTQKWLGQLIDVSCVTTDIDGKPRRFDYRYSNGHQIFNYVMEKYFLAQRGGYCHG